MLRVMGGAGSAVVLALTMWACAGGGPSQPSPPATPRLTLVTVIGTAPAIGASSQFVASATLSDATTQPVTSQATWNSSAATVATVSGSGVVTALAAGETEISATYQSVIGRLRVTIAAAPAPKTFSVTGVVSDAFNGTGLGAATVTIGSKTTTTDANGRYTLTGLNAGTITITVERIGFMPGTRTSTISADTQINIALDRAASPPPTANLSLTFSPDPVPFVPCSGACSPYRVTYTLKETNGVDVGALTFNLVYVISGRRSEATYPNFLPGLSASGSFQAEQGGDCSSASSCSEQMAGGGSLQMTISGLDTFGHPVSVSRTVVFRAP